MIMEQAGIVPRISGTDRVTAARIIEAARAEDRHMLGIEAFDILKAYGIPVVKTIFAKTVEEAVNAER